MDSRSYHEHYPTNSVDSNELSELRTYLLRGLHNDSLTLPSALGGDLDVPEHEPNDATRSSPRFWTAGARSCPSSTETSGYCSPSDLQRQESLSVDYSSPERIASQAMVAAPEVQLSDADGDADTDVVIKDSDFEPMHEASGILETTETAVESPCNFGLTKACQNLYNVNDYVVPAIINARFTKAYLEDNMEVQPCHIIYRRNYFAVAINYTLEPRTKPATGKLYLHTQTGKHPVEALGVHMRAVKNGEDGEIIPISVFTAKRGSPIHPTPHLEKIMQPNMSRTSIIYPDSTGHGGDILQRPIYHTFQRLQFRKATDNNGVRRRGQSFFRVVVELRALIFRPSGEDEWVKIASTISGPLLVRGRCPNSFEPYNPNNRKRKPAKRRSDYKGSHPRGCTKQRKGSNKQKAGNEIAMTAASQRARRQQKQTTFKNDKSPTPALASDIQTPPVSALHSPVLTSRDKIPPECRLPLLRGPNNNNKNNSRTSILPPPPAPPPPAADPADDDFSPDDFMNPLDDDDVSNPHHDDLFPVMNFDSPGHRTLRFTHTHGVDDVDVDNGQTGYASDGWLDVRGAEVEGEGEEHFEHAFHLSGRHSW